MNIFDFIAAAKKLTTNDEVVALVDKFIADNGPGNLASLRNELDEIIGGTLIADDKVYLAHMGNFVRELQKVPTLQIPADHALGNIQYPSCRMKSLNVDFEGVTPGVDQLLYDLANEKARDQPQHKFRLTDDHGGRGISCKVVPESE